MPTMKYKDPADGQWKFIAGNPATDEVQVSSGPAPTDTGVQLWMDTNTIGSGTGWEQFDARYMPMAPVKAQFTMTAPWVPYTVGAYPEAGMQMLGKLVILEGLVKAALTVVAGSQYTVCNVPAIYRPQYNLHLPGLCAITANQACRWFINVSTGDLQFMPFAAGALTWASLNGVMWMVP